MTMKFLVVKKPRIMSHGMSNEDVTMAVRDFASKQGDSN